MSVGTVRLRRASLYTRTGLVVLLAFGVKGQSWGRTLEKGLFMYCYCLECNVSFLMQCQSNLLRKCLIAGFYFVFWRTTIFFKRCFVNKPKRYFAGKNSSKRLGCLQMLVSPFQFDRKFFWKNWRLETKQKLM